VALSATAKMNASMEAWKQHVAKHPKLYPLYLVVSCAAVVVSFLYFLGPLGGVLGGALTIAGIWLGPKASKTIREKIF
jgi:hypothetical protein